ncbi:MAG: hypothetical protein R3Y64_01125 [Peptostreptococcaceae bacterium]
MESLKIYEDLINKNGSRKVLFLVENGLKKKEYVNKLETKFCEELKITTYLNFVKSELKKYWPLIKNTKKIEPTFVNNTFVEFFITKKVREYRLEKEYFYDITSSDKNISKNIISNIKYLIESNNYSKNTLSKIYEHKKEKVSELIFSNMWDIMNEYFEVFIKNEILDDNLCLYIYNNYLLNNEKYKNILNKIEYVLVDSLEKSIACEIDFLLECRNVIGFYDQSKDYSMYKNIDNDYIKKNLFNRENTKIINKEVDYIINSEKIDICDDTILFDEMIKSVLKKINELINGGYKKGDIALIVPINNNIFEENIKNSYNKEFSKENGQVFKNIKNTNRLIDKSYVNALFVALSIYLNNENILNDFEYINFIEVMFNVNKIEARKILKNENFGEFKNEIKGYENKEVYEFLQEFYLQRIIKMKHGKENIKTVRKLILESELFIKNYKIIDENFTNREFLEVIKDFLNDYNSINDLSDLNKYILISSSVSYLNSNQKRKVVIMFDLDSYNFSIDKNLSNMIITRKSFDTIYSDEIERNYKQYYISNLIYNLVNDCEKFYGFKSEYSMQGFNELTDLYELLLEIKN